MLRQLISFISASLQCSFGDFDNDGDLDLALSCAASCANMLFRNNGDKTFTNISATAGITHTGNHNAVHWADVNNDGFLDLYISEQSGNGNRLYINQRNSTFLERGNSGDLDVDGEPAGNVRGSVLVDFNGDGAIDIHAPVQGGADWLYKNDATPHPQTFFQLEIRGLNGARNLYGVQVELLDEGTRLYTRMVDGGGSFGTQSYLPVYFYNLSPEKQYSVRVHYPDGKSQTFNVGTPDGSGLSVLTRTVAIDTGE